MSLCITETIVRLWFSLIIHVSNAFIIKHKGKSGGKILKLLQKALGNKIVSKRLIFMVLI